MRFGFILFLNIALMLLLSGCLRPVDPADPGGPLPAYDWTVLVYQGGDNTLAGGLNGDLYEMSIATIGSRIAVIAQNDNADDGMKRYRLGNGQVEELGSLGRGDSATATRVAEFLEWGMRKYPGRRVALILGSHGHGWRRGSMRKPMTGLLPSVVPDPAIVTDDEYKSEIDLPPLRRAIEETLTRVAGDQPWLVSSENGKTRARLDLLGFDACLMGMLETAWETRNCTRFLVSSQANTPTNGWPYDRWLSELAGDPASFDGGSLGKLIGERFRDDYQSASNAGISGTLSTIEMARFPLLADAFTALAAALDSRKQALSASLIALRDARRAAPGIAYPGESFSLQAFDQNDFRDLDDLASGVAVLAPDLATLSVAVRSALSAATFARVQFGARYLRSNGLSVSFPGSNEAPAYHASGTDPLYRDLALSRETAWDELLEMLLANGATGGRVPGRNFTCTLSWDTASDLDLLLGEPDPLAPNDPVRAIWNQAALQPVTQNGSFSGDSRQTAVASEVWRAAATLQPGRYWVVVSAHWRSPVDATSTPRLTCSGDAGVTTAIVRDGPVLRSGNRWDAGFIEVGAGGITASFTGKTP